MAMEEMPGHSEQGSACIGSVTTIDGSKVSLELLAREGRPTVRVTVGNVVRIRAGAAVLIGIITTLSSSTDRTRASTAGACLDLLGEILSDLLSRHR